MSEILGHARLADQLGYDSLWVPESWGRDAISILGALAVATKRAQLGTGIITVFSRSPALIAQSVATLDELSGGRMVLGLGASSPRVVQDWHGVQWERPLQRTREYIEIIRLALARGRVDYNGSFFQLKDFRLSVEPAGRRVPIFLAAMGPQNVRLAGELADGWMPTLVAPHQLKELRDPLYEAAKAKGRKPEDVTIAAWIAAAVSDNEDEAVNLVRPHITHYFCGMGTFYAESARRAGFGKVVDAMRAAWEQGRKDEAAAIMPKEMVKTYAAAGTPAQARAKIDDYLKAGAQLAVIQAPRGASKEAIERTLKALA